MSEVGDVREGFLCPVCLADLGALSQLQQHFDEAHSSEDKDVVDQLKGFFSLAKRKLLGEEAVPSEDYEASGPSQTETSSTTEHGYEPTEWPPQELGATRSHTDIFRQTRSSRVDSFIMETNKLIIRLDKLVNEDAPTDPGKRKAYEKSVVPWASDADFNYCVTCRRGFSLMRRRHHCRLCGDILCHSCSQFLPEPYAKQMTNPALPYEGEGFRRSGSTGSLNSMMSNEGQLHLRVCGKCRGLLETRLKHTQQRHHTPLISQLYQKMKQYQEEADRLLPDFLQMATSLLDGYSQYGLPEAQQLRNRIIKLYESIDLLSKRILKLGEGDSEPPGPRSQQLQKSIRSAMNAYLQSNLLGLQSLPSAEDLAKLQENRRVETEQKLEAERRLTAEREAKQARELQKVVSPRVTEVARRTLKSLSDRGSKQDQGATGSGWKPLAVVSKGEGSPMIEQMNIIRGFVKQAKEAGRWDEVEMLEANLRELQEEYWQRQTAT